MGCQNCLLCSKFVCVHTGAGICTHAHMTHIHILFLCLSNTKSLLKTCFARCKTRKSLESQKERMHTNRFKAETNTEAAALTSIYSPNKASEGHILSGKQN